MQPAAETHLTKQHVLNYHNTDIKDKKKVSDNMSSRLLSHFSRVHVQYMQVFIQLTAAS